MLHQQMRTQGEIVMLAAHNALPTLIGQSKGEVLSKMGSHLTHSVSFTPDDSAIDQPTALLRLFWTAGHILFASTITNSTLFKR